jgi:hypothetical protein
MNERYMQINQFMITLCRLSIVSEKIPDWGYINALEFDKRIENFVYTYKKQIDKYVPYWIENA